MNNDKTPLVRFKGYTDTWEHSKLGDLVEFYNGDRSSRYPNDKDMVTEGIPFINAGDLVNGRVKLDTANKITEKKYNELSGAKIQLGDIIYCLRGTLGKNGFIDNFEVGTIASSLVDIRPKSIVGKYLFHVLNSDIEWRQRTINDEGAAQPNLSAKNLSLFDIPISNLEEQLKIATYFDNLDSLITLHQRKYDKLLSIKKSLLEKMFPKDGSLYPEIRFNQFTKAWEQRKLGEIFSIAKSGGTPDTTNQEYYNGTIPFLGIADIDGRTIDETAKHISEDGLNNSTAQIINAGSISLAMYASVGKVGILTLDAATSQAFFNMTFDSNATRDFIYSILNKAEINNEWEPLISAGTQKNLNANKIKQLDLLIPSVFEQKAIGEYFAKLDNLITLNQRKLEKLKNLKQSMLEKMFI